MMAPTMGLLVIGGGEASYWIDREDVARIRVAN